MSHRRQRSPGRLRSAALTVGAALGVLCIGGVLAGAVLGIRPMIVTSGSMSPTIPAGSLVVAKDTAAADVGVGDVVAVVVGDGRVMHRVVAAQSAGADTVLTLQGDANATPDQDPYVVRQVARVWFDIPLLGYPVSWLSTPLGLIGLGIGACGLLVFAFRPTPAGVAGRRRVAASVAAPASVLLLVTGASPTSAMFTDGGSVTSGAIVTYTVPKPVWVSCTVTGGLQKTATIVWQEVSSPYPLNYVARIVSPNTPMTVTDNGSTRQTQFSAGLLSTILNQTYNIEIRATLPAPNSSWQSVALIQPVTVTLLGLGMSCGTPS